jgi:hypothetical protein
VLGTAQFLRSQSYRIYETLLSAGIVYILLVFILTRILNWFERYLNKDRERPVAIPLAQTVKRILSKTCRTLSGCWRALSSRFALPNDRSARSVPAEITLARVRIRREPGWTRGQGTSVSCVSPLLRSWRICFISASRRAVNQL